MIGRLAKFLQQEIWRIRIRTLPRPRYWLLRSLRIILLALRGFAEDGCQLRASSLTFYSLLSIVPVVAMAFGLAKGFGFEQTLQSILSDKLQGQEEVMTWVIGFSQSLLESAKGGVIAGVGIVVLFWTVVQVLGHIEKSFNAIWAIQQERSLGRKVADYLSIMLILPVLLLIASSVTVTLMSQLAVITAKLSFLGPVSSVILLGLKLIPYVLLWAALTFTYLFMPNTRVSFRAGLAGGILAGTLYQLVQWGYVHFQFGVAKYNAIYGSFAALPLFLLWLQISWLVVLFGAEIAFAVEHEETYEFELDCDQASARSRRVVALCIMAMCVRRFVKGEGALSVREMAERLEAPIRMVRGVLHELVRAGLLSEVVSTGNSGEQYQPARDTERLTILDVLTALDRSGLDSSSLIQGAEVSTVIRQLDAFERHVSGMPDNLLIRHLPV